MKVDMKSLLPKLGYGLTVLGHLVVAGILYLGIYGGDSDPRNWDMPNIVGLLTLFLYVGGYASDWVRHFVERRTGINLTRSFYMMAITLPTLSVIFSCIGIGAVFLLKGTVRRETDKIYLVGLYILNVLFIGILSRSLGLWTGVCIGDKKGSCEKEKEQVPDKAPDSPVPSFISSKTHED